MFFPAPVLRFPDWEVIHEERWPADAANPHEASYLILIIEIIVQTLAGFSCLFLGSMPIRRTGP